MDVEPQPQPRRQADVTPRSPQHRLASTQHRDECLQPRGFATLCGARYALCDEIDCHLLIDVAAERGAAARGIGAKEPGAIDSKELLIDPAADRGSFDAALDGDSDRWIANQRELAALVIQLIEFGEQCRTRPAVAV